MWKERNLKGVERSVCLVGHEPGLTDYLPKEPVQRQRTPEPPSLPELWYCGKAGANEGILMVPPGTSR